MDSEVSDSSRSGTGDPEPYCYRKLFLGKEWKSGEPVSYTHLDVYKRQRFVSKTKECFAYNTKIIETPTTKEVYIYENPIFSHAIEKADLEKTSKRKTFDEKMCIRDRDNGFQNFSFSFI